MEQRFKKVFKVAKHSGGLKECLESEVEITLDEFNSIKKLYTFYAYDERIKAARYLNTSLEYPWLHIYYVKEEL